MRIHTLIVGTLLALSCRQPAMPPPMTPGTTAPVEVWRQHIKFGDDITAVEEKLASVYPGRPVTKLEGDKDVGGVSSLKLDLTSEEISDAPCRDLRLFFSFDLKDHLRKVTYEAKACSYWEGLPSLFLAMHGAPAECYEQRVTSYNVLLPIERRCVWIDRDGDLFVELRTSVEADGEGGRGPLKATYIPLSSSKFDVADPEQRLW